MDQVEVDVADVPPWLWGPGEMDIWSFGEKKQLTVEARLLTKNNLSLKLKSETSSSLCIGATFLGFPAQTLLMICVLTWILFTAVVNALKGTVFGNKCLVTMFRDLDHRLWSSWWFDSFKLSFFEQIYELLAKWSETFFFLNNKLWSICRLWVTVAGTLLRHRSWSLHRIIVEQSCVLFPPCIWTGAHRPMAAHASCDIISKLASLPSYGEPRLTHVILWTNRLATTICKH